jgi:hypothetical protein
MSGSIITCLIKEMSTDSVRIIWVMKGPRRIFFLLFKMTHFEVAVIQFSLIAVMNYTFEAFDRFFDGSYNIFQYYYFYYKFNNYNSQELVIIYINNYI